MNFKNLFKKNLFSYFISPAFLICSLLFYFTVILQHFIFKKFFVLGFGSSDLNSFFNIIPYVFSLIIPVLILQICDDENEEVYPYPVFLIDLSKVLSTVTVIFLMLVPLFAVPVFVNIFGAVDLSQSILGFTGIILYSFVAVSLCLFLKNIFNSKSAFVAVSVVVLILIDSFHIVPVYFNLSNGLTHFFQSISFVWHFDSFSKGIIDTRDCLFYLIWTLIFILCSAFYAEYIKGKNYFSGNYKSSSILIVLIIIFSLLDNSKYYLKIDFTKEKQFSVSKYTKENLKEASEPVVIKYYQSRELLKRYPQVKDVYEYLNMISRENKNISLKVIDAGKKENQDALEILGIKPNQIQDVDNNKAEYVNVYSCIVIEYMGHQEVLPFVLSTVSLEFELNLRFESLIKNKKHFVYILTGNEYSIDDYGYVPYLFNTSDIISIPVTKEMLGDSDFVFDNKIPLIVFGTSELSDYECSRLEDFIISGGKTIIATSQYKINFDRQWNVSKNKNDNFIPVLKKWGVEFSDSLVNDLSNVRWGFHTSDNESEDSIRYSYVNYPEWVNVLPQENVPSGITMYWASPIKENQNIKPLFYSSKMSWQVHEFDESVAEQTGELFVINPFLIDKNVKDDPLFINERSVLGAKISSPIKSFYGFSKCENPEVIVLSGQYFALNLLLELSGGETGDFRNLDFLLSQYLLIEDQIELFKLQHSGVKNSSLYKIQDEIIFEQKKSFVLFLLFAVIPVLILISNIIFFIKRKKENEKYRH